MGRSWYFSRQEIEFHSPSRRDGITLSAESKLRSQYCSHIQQIGSKLRVPHLTIATAIMLCHRFYARQSHAKNDWHTVATACVFLASKAEDTPRSLGDVVSAVYGQQIHDQIVSQMIKYRINPHDVREKDEFCGVRARLLTREKKELIIAAERVVLTTIGFDLEIQLPYKTLVAALKRLGNDKITGGFVLTELTNVAWSLVDGWLKTALCLQYKPQYIAVGSVVVSARLLNVKLPAGDKWLEEVGVFPEVLDEVIQMMQSKIYRLKTKQVIGIVSFYEVCCH